MNKDIKLESKINLDKLAFEIGHEANISSKTLVAFILDMLQHSDDATIKTYKALHRQMKDWGEVE